MFLYLSFFVSLNLSFSVCLSLFVYLSGLLACRRGNALAYLLATSRTKPTGLYDRQWEILNFLFRFFSLFFLLSLFPFRSFHFQVLNFFLSPHPFNVTATCSVFSPNDSPPTHNPGTWHRFIKCPVLFIVKIALIHFTQVSKVIACCFTQTS